MSIKNKLASIVALPAGVVFVVDHFVTNMPMVMEGGLWVAGMGVAAMGVEGTRKLVNSLTADKPATQEGQPASEPQVAPEASFPAPMTVHQLPAAPSREDLLKAFQMGAQAATSQQRLERLASPLGRRILRPRG
jgi:hypothetical protein